MQSFASQLTALGSDSVVWYTKTWLASVEPMDSELNWIFIYLSKEGDNQHTHFLCLQKIAIKILAFLHKIRLHFVTCGREEVEKYEEEEDKKLIAL